MIRNWSFFELKRTNSFHKKIFTFFLPEDIFLLSFFMLLSEDKMLLKLLCRPFKWTCSYHRAAPEQLSIPLNELPCSSQNMFLYFFELVAHWREIHDFNSHLLWYHYDALTLEEHKQRDANLVKNSWSCQVCESGEKYYFKFQLASHWIENHSNPEVTYEVCQWCSEIFVNTVYSGRVCLYL